MTVNQCLNLASEICPVTLTVSFFNTDNFKTKNKNKSEQIYLKYVCNKHMYSDMCKKT